jgi:two-component sensor histidine kinase
MVAPTTFRLSRGVGRARVKLKCQPDSFSISVSDSGDGPAAGQSNAGLGSTIVEALSQQINATVEKERLEDGYTVTVMVPQAKPSAAKNHLFHRL